MPSSEKGKFIQLLETLFVDLEKGVIIESDISFYSFLCSSASSNKTLHRSIKELAAEYIVSHRNKSTRSIHGHLSRLQTSGHLSKNGSLIEIKTFVRNKNEYVIKGKTFKRQ